MKIRLGSGADSISAYKDYGSNSAMLGDAIKLATYDDVCPGVISSGSDFRLSIERKRSAFLKECDLAKELGIKVCVLTDEVSLPLQIAEQLRKAGVIDAGTGRIDLTREEFWKLHRAKYREILKAYPQIAYVMIRTGENYSSEKNGFIGQTLSGKTYDAVYFRDMTRLIEETRRIVVNEFGRTLIWRTWDLGNDGFHANPAVYDRVLAGLPEKMGLLFAIKHTQTDFWRYNDFNPMIGRGGVDQIVEFQCSREYEGKGAFPNYLGALYAEDMSKTVSAGALGVWIWHSEGGWGGPRVKSDRWRRLNIDAVSRLALDPAASPRAIALEWATQEFGENAAPNVAEILMLSPECVRKFVYIEAYARNHKGWKPSLNLMRDDVIRGADLRKLYLGSKTSLPAVREEKDEAVAMAARMRTMFERSKDDIVSARGDLVYQESLTSLIYMESLAEVMRRYVNGMFAFYNWQETKDAKSAEIALNDLLAWREAWAVHREEIPKLPAVSSVYRSMNRPENPFDKSPEDGAMADLCEAAIKTLGERHSISGAR